ncbi:glutaminyl-peptide cyclotransferase [Danxiaibacter flavus]|uniref:Glutaminyl-peptide cyclotransferase n=1 Tax=Danxiaibacter flavus TaxID=3049108 RepID=A0ABV3ZLU0_9BACT|nr:glutaminyl-peptide cyclotransferase [Chitinophagaceae bacterium DXS]
MKNLIRCILVSGVIGLAACGNGTESSDTSKDSGSAATNPVSYVPPAIQYNVIKVYPHDTSSYTQGLIWYNNTLYEGTGLKEKSKLLKVDLNTGKQNQQVKLDNEYFGEGITILNNKIYQLTWQEHKVFVYDLNTFKKVQEFEWPYDGWGLTNNGKELIISTGGNNLYFVDPATFKILKTVGVSNNYGPVSDINELEYVNGFVYANIYETDNIIKINPETGAVVGKLDLTDILSKNGVVYNREQIGPNTGNVLNGIAFDSAKNSFYVTGKCWPALFEIKLN